MQNRFTRRKFLQTSALAAAGVSSPLWQSRTHAQAATPLSKGTLPAIASGPFSGSRESQNLADNRPMCKVSCTMIASQQDRRYSFTFRRRPSLR